MAVLLANNATGRLAGSIDSTQVNVSLQAGEGSRFPSPTGSDWFPITFTKPNGEIEIMHCTSRTNDVLTVTRAQEGTSAKTFVSGDRCALRVTVAAYEDMRSSKGDIKLWSGAIVDIPTGWALCNGTNGTIDLTDRFVVGAGSTYLVGNTGGADSVTLTAAQMPAHNHTTNGAGGHAHTASTGSAGSHSHSGSTNTTGSHTHTDTGNDRYDGGQANHFFINRTQQLHSASTNAAGDHSHTLWINANGAHTHSVTVDAVTDHTHTVNNTGGGGSHENRPPYYALAFIQKL